MHLRTLVPGLLLAAILAAPSAEAVTLVFPGCGPSIQACVNDAPTGSTIELKTNSLIPIPADDGLVIKKALTIQAAPGYNPKLGSESEPGYISVDISPSSGRTVAFRGITFQQVGTSVEVGGTASGHEVIFENNKVMNDAGTNGAYGISVYFQAPAEGSITIRNNLVNSAGVGIEASASGGPLRITGNRVTSPVRGDSQGGIFVFANGDEKVKGTIASNLVHGVAGCGCGSPSALQARAFDQTVFDLRILNNTVSPAPVDTPSSGGVYAIMIVDPYSDPEAIIKASLYNNLVANSQAGIVLYEDEQLKVRGDRNNTYNTPDGDHLGSYDLGTTTHDDPLFVSETDFRLQEASPMREGGRSCMRSIPLPRGDVARNFRLDGFFVDIGAYEYASDIPASVPGANITDGNDSHTIDGTRGIDIICGNGGNDVINAKARRDYAFGGSGSDDVSGASGNDFLFLSDGVESNDIARGGPGLDRCVTDPSDTQMSCTAPSG